MSKQSIKWHQKCLRNKKATLKQAQDSLELQQAAVKSLEDSIGSLELQIKMAIGQKKDAFDSDKFLATYRKP